MRKPFLLSVREEIVPLKWDTWAMARFCELAGNIPLSGLFEVYDSNVFSLKHVIYMIVAGAESADEKRTVTERQAAQWIDEAGGLTDTGSDVLKFIRYTNDQQQTDVTEEKPVGGAEEKKSQP